MLQELRYTLLSDGVSDQALLPLLTWLLRQQQVNCPIQPEWADLRWLRHPPKTLANRIRTSLDLFPCDLLFVHRDAESGPREKRVTEINTALAELKQATVSAVVCVVPVRMQEAWLLFDEPALRRAAGNPSGKQRLTLPPLGKLESLPDPKSLLHELLREASGLQGRRRKQFPASTNARRVAEFTQDFAPLRALPAFSALETDVAAIVEQYFAELKG